MPQASALKKAAWVLSPIIRHCLASDTAKIVMELFSYAQLGYWYTEVRLPNAKMDISAMASESTFDEIVNLVAFLTSEKKW